MTFSYDKWNTAKKDSFTYRDEWARIEDEGCSENVGDKTEFDLFGTALNEL